MFDTSLEPTSCYMGFLGVQIATMTSRRCATRSSHVKAQLMTAPPLCDESIAERFGVTHMWFCTRCALRQPPRDGLFGGVIDTGDTHSFPFVLLMRFKTKEDLMRLFTED